MTINEILHDLKSRKKLSRPQLYVHIRRLKIKPLGARQIPQQYPPDTPHRILFKLGLVKGRVTVTPRLTSKKSKSH